MVEFWKIVLDKSPSLCLLNSMQQPDRNLRFVSESGRWRQFARESEREVYSNDLRERAYRRCKVHYIDTGYATCLCLLRHLSSHKFPQICPTPLHVSLLISAAIALSLNFINTSAHTQQHTYTRSFKTTHTRPPHTSSHGPEERRHSHYRCRSYVSFVPPCLP